MKKEKTKFYSFIEKIDKKKEHTPLGDLCEDILRDEGFSKKGNFKDQLSYLKFKAIECNHIKEALKELEARFLSEKRKKRSLIYPPIKSPENNHIFL